MAGINNIDVEPEAEAEPDLAFKITELIHNNPLMHFFRNPYKLLKAAGLKPGLKVLEAGCGTGFFTVPASEIVGRDGFIYAVDIHPLAIKRVEEKIKQHGISNVEPVLVDAYKTDLQNESIDVAFKIRKLKENLEIHGKPLRAQLHGYWELYFERKFRIIFTIDYQRKIVTIEAIKHKNEF